MIVGVITFINRDPLFGSIFIWASLAIRTQLIKRGNSDMILTNLQVIIIIFSVYIVAILIWLVLIKMKPLAKTGEIKTLSLKEKLLTSSHGLLY